MSKVEAAKRRREEKLKATRTKQNLIIAALVLFLILAGVGGYYIVNSDFWLLKSIQITGNSYISAEQVADLAGIDERTNLMKISKKSIESDIEKDPRIAKAEIRRDLPSCIHITIVERLPFAKIRDGLIFYTLDKHGYVIESTKEMTTDTVPLINDIKTGRLNVGNRAKTKLLRKALASLRALDPDMRAKVMWVSVPSIDKLAFHTTDDIEIIYGGAENAKIKNAAIEQILKESKDTVIHINVTIPEKPIKRVLKI